MRATRRSALRAGIGIIAASGLSGCLGGGGGSDENGTNQSGNGSATDSTTGVEATTAGPQQNILASEPEFNDNEMSISLDGETKVDLVRLADPQGQTFETYEPHDYEGAATFTLIKKSSKQFGYKRYPFGEYTATAFSKGNRVDQASYSLKPEFTVNSVKSGGGRVKLTFENIGTAPAPITAARIYNAKKQFGPNQFGGGFVDEGTITEPEDTISVRTRLLGFESQFPPTTDPTATETTTTTERNYCSGTSRAVTVSYRVFNEIRETTGSLVFGGELMEGPEGSVGCSEYTLNSARNLRTAAPGTTTGGTRTTTGAGNGQGAKTATPIGKSSTENNSTSST